MNLKIMFPLLVLTVHAVFSAPIGHGSSALVNLKHNAQAAVARNVHSSRFASNAGRVDELDVDDLDADEARELDSEDLDADEARELDSEDLDADEARELDSEDLDMDELDSDELDDDEMDSDDLDVDEMDADDLDVDELDADSFFPIMSSMKDAGVPIPPAVANIGSMFGM